MYVYYPNEIKLKIKEVNTLLQINMASFFSPPLQVAVRGTVKDFERVYKKDTSRLHLRDSSNSVPFHHACGAGKIEIMEFILAKGGGMWPGYFQVLHVCSLLYKSLMCKYVCVSHDTGPFYIANL